MNGLAIGASSSGFAAELFMIKLEKRALLTFVDPPSIWKRYVDDTFSKLKKISVALFLNQVHHRGTGRQQITIFRHSNSCTGRQVNKDHNLQKSNTYRPVSRF